MNLNVIYDVIIDSLKDSALVLPFLIVTYILIEIIEKRIEIINQGLLLGGTMGPFFGSLSSIIPQCGFSVMSAKLYNKSLITTGTLLSVFIATSDEAFAILISNGEFLVLTKLILLKIIFATSIGLIINKIFYQQNNDNILVSCNDIAVEHENVEENKIKNKFILDPLLHSFTTFCFILFINFTFNLVICLLGEDQILQFMNFKGYFQPFVVSLVGLIPNCSSSILITQLYLLKGIKFGSLFAGLSVNAGIGLAILLKNKEKLKNNIILVMFLYFISSIAGVIINIFL